jgi:hypothetical protein
MLSSMHPGYVLQGAWLRLNEIISGFFQLNCGKAYTIRVLYGIGRISSLIVFAADYLHIF